jgi:outer membrane immunogenic protein
MKKLLLTSVMFVALIAPAAAADLARPVYARPVAVAVPVYTWTGFYIGGNVGGAWENTETNYSTVSTPAPNPPGFQDVFGQGGPLNVGGLPAVDSAIAQGFIPTSLGNRHPGLFTAGGQAGYNFQINQFVLGAEADINWFNDGVRTTGFNAPPNIINLTNTDSQSAGLRWIGTLRGRLGWAADRALFYATGGLAYGKAVASSNATSSLGNITDVFAGDASGVRTGYTVGGGLEYALINNVTIKAEYLYYNLGTATYEVAPANVFAAGEGLHITANQKFDGSLVRFGLNYKFGNY